MTGTSAAIPGQASHRTRPRFQKSIRQCRRATHVLAEPRSKPIEAYSSPLSAMLVLRRAERLRMLRVNTLAAMPADKVGQAVREQAQRRPGRKKAKAE
jgi:hypothetical protein